MKVTEAVKKSRIGIAVRWWETGNNDIPYYASVHPRHMAVRLLEAQNVERYANSPDGFLFYTISDLREDWQPVDPRAPLEELADVAE